MLKFVPQPRRMTRVAPIGECSDPIADAEVHRKASAHPRGESAGEKWGNIKPSILVFSSHQLTTVGAAFACFLRYPPWCDGDNIDVCRSLGRCPAETMISRCDVLLRAFLPRSSSMSMTGGYFPLMVSWVYIFPVQILP